MRLKFFSLIFIFLISVQVGCSQDSTSKNKKSQNYKTDDEKLQNLKTQATEMFKALYEEKNYEKAIDLTYYPNPKMKENALFRQNLAQKMKESLKFADETFASWSWSIEEPDSLVSIGNQLFGVVPKTIEGISKIKGGKIVQKSCTVGISDDGGDNWTFANCEGLKKWFPNLANKISMPEQKTFINGEEQ